MRAQSRDKQIEERMLAHRQDDNNRHATRHQVNGDSLSSCLPAQPFHLGSLLHIPEKLLGQSWPCPAASSSKEFLVSLQ